MFFFNSPKAHSTIQYGHHYHKSWWLAISYFQPKVWEGGAHSQSTNILFWSDCVGLTCKFDGLYLKKAFEGDEYHSTLVISTHGILLNIHYFSSQLFFDLEEIIFENFEHFWK